MCYLQVYYEVNQPYIYIYLFPLGRFPSHLGTREHWIELPVLYRRFSWVIYLIHSSVHILVPIHTRPLSPYPKGSTHLFSTSVSLFLPCKQVQLYHFSRLHMYALIYDVCFSLSDLLNPVWQSLDPFTSVQNGRISFLRRGKLGVILLKMKTEAEVEDLSANLISN